MAVPAWPRIVVHVDMDTLDIDVKSVRLPFIYPSPLSRIGLYDCFIVH